MAVSLSKCGLFIWSYLTSHNLNRNSLPTWLHLTLPKPSHHAFFFCRPLDWNSPHCFFFFFLPSLLLYKISFYWFQVLLSLMLTLWDIFHEQSYHLWTKAEDQEVEERNQWGFLRLRTLGRLVPYLRLLCSLGQNQTNDEGGDWETNPCLYGKGDKIIAQKGLWDWEHWLCSSWQIIVITEIVSLTVCVSHVSHV